MNPIINQLVKATKLSKKKIESLIEIPPRGLGDLSFPCFTLGKDKAREIASKIKTGGLIKEVKVMGPYINFFYDETTLTEQTLKNIWKGKYGYKPKKNKTIIIEFLSPNTNKPLHLGHARNMALGESMTQIFSIEGYKVIKACLYNDRGVHITKSMIAYDKWGKGKKPNKKSDHFVGDYYVMFSEKSKTTPSLIDEAQAMLRQWEARDQKVMNLWKQMNQWAYKGHKETMKRFGLKFNKFYYESNLYKKGKEIVTKGLKKGIFNKEPNGAVSVDLGKLGKKILQRGDGTAVYITQDMYLGELKYKDYKYDKSIYVVASEQEHHFRVLFKIFELLGYKFAKNCHHLSYGMVYLPSGRMKSREGTVVDTDNLMDELQSMALNEMKKRKKKPNKGIAEKIGLGAIKYYLLKYAAHKDITFNPEESVSFEGKTGPYIQYSYVRANKILKKAGIKPTIRINFELLSKESEIALVKKLHELPKAITKAAQAYSPHVIAEYAHELASQFNTFYEKAHVINAEIEKLKKARLLLVAAYAQVIKLCMNLLGIAEVEKM